MQKLVIPGKLCGINELTRGHWATRNRTKQDSLQLVAAYIRQQRLQAVDGKVTITIQCYEPNQRRDDDNVTGGAAKVILDALQATGIIKSDGQKYVQCVKLPAILDRQNPRIEVEVR